MFDYLMYYQKQWMQSEGPAKFSVFGRSDRTDNPLEVYHRDLNAMLQQNTQPDAKNFFGIIIKVQMKNWLYLKSIEEEKVHTPKKTKEQLERDQNIREGWKRMRLNEWTYKDFIDDLSRFEGEDEDGFVPRYLEPMVPTKGLFTRKRTSVASWAPGKQTATVSSEDIFKTPIYIMQNDQISLRAAQNILNLKNNNTVIISGTNLTKP